MARQSRMGRGFGAPAERFAPHKFETYIQVDGVLPIIYVQPDALEDMFALVDIVRDEVGWIGSVRRLENDGFLIEEIFLPKQTASAVTCELTPAGISAWGTEMLNSRADGLDVVNSVRFWGHSHHTMGTSPSKQDEEQLFEMALDCEDFFIRGIFNKQGRIEFVLYWVEKGLIFRDVQWKVYEPIPEGRREYWEDETKAKISPHYTGGGIVVHRGLHGSVGGYEPYGGGPENLLAEHDFADTPPEEGTVGDLVKEARKTVDELYEKGLGRTAEEVAGPANGWKGKAPKNSKKFM